MTDPETTMTTRVGSPRLLRAAAALALLAALGPRAAAGEPPAGGMRVWVDPETGEFRSAPPPPISPAARAAPPAERRRRAEEVLEPPVASDQPGGGFALDPRGYFDAEMRATLGPDGRVVVRCVPGGPTP
jgi:hypothetical protein